MAEDIVKTPNDLDFTDSDMMMIMMLPMMLIVMSAVMAPMAQSVQRYYAGQTYQGNVESNMLHVTSVVQYWDLINQPPYVPLISVFFINRGTSRAYVSINAAQDWLEIWPGETRVVSHIGADKRIEMIFYRCDPGNTTVVEAEGHF